MTSTPAILPCGARVTWRDPSGLRTLGRHSCFRRPPRGSPRTIDFLHMGNRRSVQRGVLRDPDQGGAAGFSNDEPPLPVRREDLTGISKNTAGEDICFPNVPESARRLNSQNTGPGQANCRDFHFAREYSMPLFSSCAHVALDFDAECGTPGGSERDIEILRKYRDHDGRAAVYNRENPLNMFRISYETTADYPCAAIESITIKFIQGHFEDQEDEAARWVSNILSLLPTFGPEIIAAISRGCGMITFDSCCEGWSFIHEENKSSHALLRYRARAVDMLTRHDALGENFPGPEVSP